MVTSGTTHHPESGGPVGVVLFLKIASHLRNVSRNKQSFMLGSSRVCSCPSASLPLGLQPENAVILPPFASPSHARSTRLSLDLSTQWGKPFFLWFHSFKVLKSQGANDQANKLSFLLRSGCSRTSYIWPSINVLKSMGLLSCKCAHKDFARSVCVPKKEAECGWLFSSCANPTPTDRMRGAHEGESELFPSIAPSSEAAQHTHKHEKWLQPGKPQDWRQYDTPSLPLPPQQPCPTPLWMSPGHSHTSSRVLREIWSMEAKGKEIQSFRMPNIDLQLRSQKCGECVQPW